MENKNTEAVSQNTYDIKKLAGRIYDLDKRVYEAIGSELGRVFTGDRDLMIDEIYNMFQDTKDSHYVRSTLALISNMARSIENKQIHKEVLTEYNSIINEVDEISFKIEHADIKDNNLLEVNAFMMKKRFDEGEHLIICISRSYGAGGDEIGFDLSDKLKIDYYDEEIFESVLKRLEAEQDGIKDIRPMKTGVEALKDKKGRLGFGNNKSEFTLKERLDKWYRYHGLPIRDAVFFNQSDLIVDMSKKNDFVVMGRCADRILLNNRIPHISIYITAPLKRRIHRVMQINHVDKKTALKQIKEVDKAHSSYYNFYTGKKWGDAINYDLSINSASYGIEGSVNFILSVLNANGISAK